MIGGRSVKRLEEQHKYASSMPNTTQTNNKSEQHTKSAVRPTDEDMVTKLGSPWGDEFATGVARCIQSKKISVSAAVSGGQAEKRRVRGPSNNSAVASTKVGDSGPSAATTTLLWVLCRRSGKESALEQRSLQLLDMDHSDYTKR